MSLVKLITIDSRVWRRHEAITNANSLEVDFEIRSWVFRVNLASNCWYPLAYIKTC